MSQGLSEATDDQKIEEAFGLILESGDISLDGASLAEILLSLRKSLNIQRVSAFLIAKTITEEIRVDDLREFSALINDAFDDLNQLIIRISQKIGNQVE